MLRPSKPRSPYRPRPPIIAPLAEGNGRTSQGGIDRADASPLEPNGDARECQGKTVATPSHPVVGPLLQMAIGDPALKRHGRERFLRYRFASLGECYRARAGWAGSWLVRADNIRGKPTELSNSTFSCLTRHGKTKNQNEGMKMRKCDNDMS